MKKVLTVLLVIAVMFTFSFGSAFAFEAGDAPDTISDQYFENLWAEYVKVTSVETVNVEGWNVDKTIVSGFKDEAKAVYDKHMKDQTAYITTVADLATVLAASTDEAKAFRLNVAAAQFAADKGDALAKLATVPTYDYSTAVMSDDDAKLAQMATAPEAATTNAEKLEQAKVKFVDKDYTYKQAAEKLVAYFEEEIEDLDDFDADVAVGDYQEAAQKAADKANAAVYPMCYVAGAVISSTGIYDLAVAYGTVPTGNVDDETPAVPYVNVKDTVNNWYADTVASSEKTEAATVAAVKAMNAAKYAAASVNASNDKIKYLDKWLKVADVLAEEGYSYSGSKVIAEPAYDAATDAGNYKYRGEKMIALEEFAARWAAEKNADGELIRDAAKVQKYLDEGIVAIATCDYAQIDAKYDEACANILGAISETIADKLAFAKESAKKAIELFVSDAEEDEVYYAAELAEVKKQAETYTAKVDAAEDQKEVYDAYVEFTGKVAASKIKTADALNNEWATAMAAGADSAAKQVYEAALNYVNYYNGSNDTAATNDATDLFAEKLVDRLCTMIGESGFRTAKEIKALKKTEAIQVAQGLPTNDDVKAAKKALKDAVEALPAKATVADLALVQAASDALDAYLDVVATNDVTMNKYDNAITYLVSAYNKQFAPEVSKVSETDEAAIKALKAELTDAIDTLEALNGVVVGETTKAQTLKNYKSTLNTYLDKIRADEKKAVKDAIKAIPVNVTEADKATVVKARELFDAYVAKYNDNTAFYYDEHYGANHADKSQVCLLDGYAAADINISALTAAETVLGLNAPAPGADVQALKITAKSTAKKGSITVKWTVKGEADIDGFQVWKSTKHSKGYKKAFTTTKQSYKNTKGLKAGTRYYYKVRAYKVVDGKNVYSDWSNKARRVAK